jgi:phage-related protein
VERKIVIYGPYFSDFYEKQSDKVKDKIDYVLDLIKFEERVPKKFLKFLTGTDGLYEIKVSTTFSNIRIFCFFDEGRLLILTNCFVKKTRKSPKKHLDFAIKLKKEYFKNKIEDHE